MKTVLELLDDVYNAGYTDRQKERDYDPRGNNSYNSALVALELKNDDFDIDFHCDLCNTVIEDFKKDLYHYSGILNGKFNNHIHVCNSCHLLKKLNIFNFDI